MSNYTNMDHAGWMENTNRAIKARLSKSRSLRLRDRAKKIPDAMSEFQRRAINLLGIVGGGIYNAPVAYESIDWWHGNGISVIWRHPQFATFDDSALTRLVFLAHEARIRIDLDSAGPKMLRISLWPRSDGGRMYERHPSLNEAVADFRTWFTPDNPLNYVKSQPNGQGVGNDND